MATDYCGRPIPSLYPTGSAANNTGRNAVPRAAGPSGTLVTRRQKAFNMLLDIADGLTNPLAGPDKSNSEQADDIRTAVAWLKEELV